MKPHVVAIREKMEGEDYPELNFEFAFKLTNESERGAVLIGASKVEDYLEKLIEIILPSQQKKYKNRLFKYPGPLSSFSGKIELPYAFRIIDKQVYDSLNILREIRNQAAHSSDSFSLQEKKESLEKIYNFEDGFPVIVHRLAFDNLIKWKKENLRKSFEKNNLLEYDYEKLWNKRVPNPEKDETIQEQLTIWKLSYGLTFLCLKIQVIIDEYSLGYKSVKTWADIIETMKNKNTVSNNG